MGVGNRVSKIQQLGPKRSYFDASHLLVHRAHLRLKGIHWSGGGCAHPKTLRTAERYQGNWRSKA